MSQQLAEISSLLSGAPPARLREVTDILTWISCFLYFVAARSEDSVTRDLMAYGLIVLHLARKHGGRGWLLYDAAFRQQMAVGSLLAWTDLNASMMASTVLSAADPVGGHFCPLCQAVDHTRAESALAQLEPQAVKEPIREYRPKPYCRGECHRFNRVGGVRHLQRDASSLTGVPLVVKRTTGRRPAPGESPLPLQVHDRSIDSCVVTFRWPKISWLSIYTSFIPLFSNIGDMFHLCPLILCHVLTGLGGPGRSVVGLSL